MINSEIMKATIKLAKKNIEEKNKIKFSSEVFEECKKENKLLGICEVFAELYDWDDKTEIRDFLMEEGIEFSEKFDESHLKIESEAENDEEDLPDSICKRICGLGIRFAKLQKISIKCL